MLRRKQLLSLKLTTLFVSLAMMSAGCAQKDETPTASENVDPVGIYKLVSVGGKKVPCSHEILGAKIFIISGTFTINDGGTCKSMVAFKLPSSPNERTGEVNHTYTRQGSKLTINEEKTKNNSGIVMVEYSQTGIIKGNTFTLISPQLIGDPTTYVYQK